MNASKFLSKALPCCIALSLLPCFAGASKTTNKPESKIEKVKSIDIYVTPFYSANKGKPEYVKVYNRIDALLMKNDIPSLKKAIEIVQSDPAAVAPTTLMTIAARAYDLGLKDEAVFWFYNGKNRFITFAEIIDIKDRRFFDTVGANTAFMKLVGDVINPYAFCDLKKQREAMTRSIAWIKKNPYQSIFIEDFPSKVSDRKAALKKIETKLEQKIEETDQYMADAKNKAEFIAKRKKYHTDERFCH